MPCLQIKNLDGLDFSSASAAAQAAFRSALHAANGGRYSSTLLVQHMVTVPGCVLLMAEVVEVEPAAALEAMWDGGPAEAVASSVPAYDGFAWTVIPSSHSSSSGLEHISCEVLDELLQEDREAAAALQQALLHEVAGNGARVVATNPGGGGCGVVAGWGQQLHLKVLQLSPVEQLEEQNQEPIGSSNSERAAQGGTFSSSSGMVRVVISRGDKVLLDGLEQSMSAEGMGSAAGDAAAGGSGGGGSADAGDGSFLLLDLASVISGSSAAGCEGGRSNMEANVTAAAVTVALFQQTSLGAAESGTSGTLVSAQQTAIAMASASVAAADASPGFSTGVVGGTGVASAGVGEGADANHVPVAYVTVLLLPHEVAIELQAWVVQQQLSVHDLTPLVLDLAFVLDVRDALQLGLAWAPGVTSDWMSYDLPGLSGSAARVSESLLEFFRNTRLHSAEEFVLVLRQQLLVAMRRVTPLAAGAIPTREAAAAAARLAAGSNAADASKQGYAAAVAARGNVGSADCWGNRQEASARLGGTETGVQLEAALAADAPMQLVRTSISKRSSSRREEVVGGSSSSSATSSSSKKAAALERREHFSAADRAAAAAGGWRASILCWAGFQGQGVESQYLEFKAKHSRRIELGAKLLFAVVGMGFMLKYLPMVQWKVWPPYKIFGKQVWFGYILSRLGCGPGAFDVLQQCSLLLNGAWLLLGGPVITREFKTSWRSF